MGPSSRSSANTKKHICCLATDSRAILSNALVFLVLNPTHFFWGVPIARSQGRLLRKAKSAPTKIYHQDMSSSHDKFLKILHLSFLILAFSTNFVLLTQNVNVARFARNLECKFSTIFKQCMLCEKVQVGYFP